MMQTSLQVEGATFTDWLLEHCRQVSRMLPTGLSCRGVYITEVPQSLTESKSASSRQLFDILSSVAVILGSSELVLLTSSQGKVHCRLKNSARFVSVELKAVALPELVTLRCLVPCNIGVARELAPLDEILIKLVKQWASQLEHLKLDLSRGEVEVYCKYSGSLVTAEAPMLKVAGFIEVVVLHTAALAADKLLALVKADLLQSLKARLELLAEEKDFLSAFPQTLQLPRRIVHDCDSGLFCDYAYNTEPEEASVARVAALLAAEPKTSTCREHCEILSPVEVQVKATAPSSKWRIVGAVVAVLLALWWL
jgi:hypothetical protein